MDVVRIAISLIGAFRGYRSSTDSADKTAQRTKYYRVESLTSKTQLEMDSCDNPRPYSRSNPPFIIALNVITQEGNAKHKNSLIIVCTVQSQRGGGSDNKGYYGISAHILYI